MTPHAPGLDRARMTDAELAARYPRAWLWPVGLATLLLGSIGICVVTAVVATRDPSFALEPDYYQRAVEWDEAAAARDASATLGWTALAEVSAPGSAGQRTLTVRITDKDGQPVAADRVRVTAFHHARRRDALTLSVGHGEPSPGAGAGAVVSAGPGEWVWSIGPARAGLWQVRLEAGSGREEFLATLDVATPDGVR